MSIRRRRLQALEAAMRPQPIRPVHRIIADSDADGAAERARMIASGDASEGDRFIIRTIIAPEGNGS